MRHRATSVLAGVVCSLGFLAATAAAENAAPAPTPYRPLPVGTVLDYGSWKCRVVADANMETVCAGEKGERLTIFAHLLPVGALPQSGYGGFLKELYCPSGGATSGADSFVPIARLALSDAARAGVSGLWPLKTGTSAEFTLKLDPPLFTGNIGSFGVTIKVTGLKRAMIAGRKRTVWQIVGRSGQIECGGANGIASSALHDGYRELWWYSAEVGAVVRHEIRTAWTHRTYQLKSITFPGETPVATNAGIPPIAAAQAARRPGSEGHPAVSTAGTRAAPDTAPPRIAVPATLATGTGVVTLHGQVSDASRVVDVAIDGRSFPIGRDGRFTVRRGVPPGESRIVITALDEWGNRAERTVRVTRREPARSSPARAVSSVAARTPPARPDPFAGIRFGRYHALVIGNNRYPKLPDLETAVPDARAVADVLRRDYGFRVDLLLNATRDDVIRGLAQMRAKLTTGDDLLIYYAGHGVMDDMTQQGYWLPVDADPDVPTNWISTNDITNMLEAMRAEHVMVVADSCYSGTLVRGAAARVRTAREYVAWVRRMLHKRSRTALVSGGLEPVMDSGGYGHSVFAKAFLDALRGNRGVIDGEALFDAVKRPVVLNSDQTPRYSDIRKAGHEGGDFLFVRRGS